MRVSGDESLLVLLRLLLDETVEDLSQNSTASDSALRDAARSDKRQTCDSRKRRMAMSAAIAHITATTRNNSRECQHFGVNGVAKELKGWHQQCAQVNLEALRSRKRLSRLQVAVRPLQFGWQIGCTTTCS